MSRKLNVLQATGRILEIGGLGSSSRRAIEGPACQSFTTRHATASPAGKFPVKSVPWDSKRCISSTPFLQKKAGKSNLSHAKTDSSPPVSGAKTVTATDEAYDFSALEARILRSIERLSHDLSQLRAGGKFNTDLLETVKVTVGKGNDKHISPLRDLAQVVTRGRVVNIIAHEKEYIKPISSAILSSEHNLVPQAPTEDNPLTIPIPLPPPTGESRKQALDSAHKAMENASQSVQDARAAHQKKLRAFQKDKSVRPDDFQKAGKQMEEVVKRGKEEVRRVYEGAKKVLEQG